MKKIPFYNPASPFFFHILVSLLYIFLIFLTSLLISLSLLSIIFSIIFIILIFTAVYPFFALVMAILVRRAFINIHQTPVSEEFANKLVLYNRYLITAIYVFSFVAGFFEIEKKFPPDTAFIHLFLLFISGLCFLFYFFILPVIIRFLLLKKMSLILEIVIVGIFFLLFLLCSYIITFMIYNIRF